MFVELLPQLKIMERLTMYLKGKQDLSLKCSAWKFIPSRDRVKGRIEGGEVYSSALVVNYLAFEEPTYQILTPFTMTRTS